MHDADKLFCSFSPRIIPRSGRIDHMFKDVILYNLCNKAVHCTPARRSLLNDAGALVVRLYRSLNGIKLSTDPAKAVQKLFLFFLNVAHF